MHISLKGIDLIKAFEGLSLEAYRCSSSVPTIGYGTTRYPDGRKVQMGDRISEPQAEAFVIDECDQLVKEMESLVKVPLNQNQIDALTSFCYNLGCGALADSALLAKLNQGDAQGAAAEFLNWNKATHQGVDQEVVGLTRRRQEEKHLFETPSNEGQPIEVASSPQDQVTWLELYRMTNENNVLAAWNAAELVELIEFNRHHKEDLVAVFNQYKNAKSVHIAPEGKPIPEGVLIKMERAARAIPPLTEEPPALAGKILQRGSQGDGVQWLQARLLDLDYYHGLIDGNFGKATDDAVRAFQTAVLDQTEADGIVGPLTWAALAGKAQRASRYKIATPGKGTYLLLTQTNSKDISGLYNLRLSYIKDGQEADYISVFSGQPRHQFFRTGQESKANSLEPLPEGRWCIYDILWGYGKDNYSERASWADGLGPVKIKMAYKGPDQTECRATMIHLDWNRPLNGNTLGTASYIGVKSVADFKRMVAWIRESDPREFYVDWGLGTCPQAIASQSLAVLYSGF